MDKQNNDIPAEENWQSYLSLNNIYILIDILNTNIVKYM